jgi:soluble lytic murein transglycosylase-like protein
VNILIPISKKTSFTALTLMLMGCLLLILSGSDHGNQVTLPAYFVANQNYRTGNFNEAVKGFFAALKDNPGLIQKEPLIRFKIGYGFYQTGEFRKSLEVLESGKKYLETVKDYLVYFQALSHLHLGDTLTALQEFDKIRYDFKRSPLIPLLDSLQVEIAISRNQPDSVLYYLTEMLQSNYFDRDDIYLRMIQMWDLKHDSTEFRNHAFVFLNKFPFHHRSENIYKQLLKTYPQRIPLRDFRKLIDYLFTTKQFLTAEKLMKIQQPFALSSSEKEFFEWQFIELQYEQGEYDKVLHWCLENRKNFKSFLVLRQIDLNIARCYLRIGNVDQSIKYYLQFQKKYSRDGLSPEVLWKVAWLYEDKIDLDMAIRTYKNLLKIYPRCSFADEAFFRIGLDYFRLKNYKQARRSWEQAYKKTRVGSQKDRLMYWIARCYEKEKDYPRQIEILVKLSKRPIDSFYNLKAFYLTSDVQDSHQKIREAFWELHLHEQTFLPDYISQFKRALLVEDMLGTRWGDRELRNMTETRGEWQKIFALGELYERMQNFGFAYRRFRNVFDQNFVGLDLEEMIPVFKKLYPLYFSGEVDSAARRYKISPELIWSVMKKESAFEPKIISYANAYGLMQLLPGTASQIAPHLNMAFTSTQQLFDPLVNIQMGAYYLASLLGKYDGNYVMALAGYNAGPHRVDRWRKNFPIDDEDLIMENLEFEQTRVYVRTCLKYFWIYRAITRPGEIPQEIVQDQKRISEIFQTR